MQPGRMNFITALFLPCAVFFGSAAFLAAQEMNPTAAPDQQGQAAEPQGTYDNTPLYRIQVVGREIPAINYFHRQSQTKIAFEGTSLLPQAKGTANVKALQGRTGIDAYFTGLTPANSFGPEYLTYVLWAITPEGRPVNLGEVLPTGKKNESRINVTTNLQSFGLMVTAEPYFAVTVPSDLVVVQNVIIKDKTHGEIEAVNAHYSLLPRGAYAETAGRHEVLHPITRDERSPLELYEADNAMQIAEAAGAKKYAADSMNSAQQALDRANEYDKSKHDRKETITFAREAVQDAEDARLITIRKIRAEDEAEAQQQRIQAEQAAAEAKKAADERAAEAEQAREQQQQAELAAQRAQAEQQQAEQQAAAAQQAREQAEQATQRMAQQEQATRERLRQQLNQVLQTRETARGLIVNMSDVLFAFNKYELKPDAKVKLAKISGILLAYPDLKVQVEGYTDNIGSDEYNQKLSEERADAVKDFLVAQDVPQQNLSAEGLGKNDPIADNSTSSGRAQNRRVQLVVSGSAIGVQPQGQPGGGVATAPGAAPPAAPATPAPPAAQAPDPRYTGTSSPQ